MKPWRVLAGTVALIASVIGIVGFLTGKFSVSDIMGKPGVVEFRLDPATVFPGEGATLHWYVSNADNVTIEPGIGSVSPSGTYPVTVSGTRTYTLTAKNRTGVTTQRLVIAPTEPPMPSVQILATPNQQLKGEKVTLRWTSKDASSVLIAGIGEVPPQGSHEVVAEETRTYEIKASNRFGKTASDRVTLSVQDWPTPDLTLRAEPNPVIRGTQTTLSWESKYATQVSIEPLGNVTVGGSAPLRIDESLTVTGRAQGPGGIQEQRVFIEAVAPPPPTLAIYPPERDSQVQNANLVRQVCDDILHRLLSPHFRLIEPPSVGWSTRASNAAATPPDYVTSLNVKSTVSRGGFITKESVQVTVRLSIVRRVDSVVAWTGTASAKQSTKDVSKFIGLVDQRFAVSGFQSDVQRLEYQALSEALEKVLKSIATFRPI